MGKTKKGLMNMMIKNQYGVEIEFEAAVNLMDDAICEDVNFDLAPCTEQEFFDEYVKRHLEKYGEDFEYAKENPQT